MNQSDKARAILYRSIDEAHGYLELAIEQEKAGCDSSKLKQAAIESLQRFSNDDDLIDAMYEEDMRHEEYGQ